MYKLFTSDLGKQFIIRLSDNACIPYAPDNTDYQAFKSDLANGATLQDATGTPMTASEITTFLQGLK